MIIGGFQKFSLIDYPNKISSVVFAKGCNFRCPYCHNPELIEMASNKEVVSEDEFFSFLKTRQGKVDAVSISGGEPTLQSDLIDFIKKIKESGFLVKLDTNGSNPDMISKLAAERLVDYFAMDIKAPLEKYASVVAVPIDPAVILKSVKLIMDSGLEYEFRTTVLKELLSLKDILKIGELIKGADLYVLQKFVPTKIFDPSFLRAENYTDKEFKEMEVTLKSYVKDCFTR